MDNHLTTIKEVFTELNKIRFNIAWFKIYNMSIEVQLCKMEGKKYYISGKPIVYTFESLNLLNQFGNMLGSCKLQKVN